MSLAAKRNISDFSPGIAGRFNQKFFSRDCGIRMTILSNAKSGFEWQRIANEIDAAFVFAQADFVKVHL